MTALRAVEATGSVPKCRGIRLDGEPCGSGIVAPSGWCFAHDPERTAERLHARQLGGRSSSTLHRARRLAPPVLADLFETLERALVEVRVGVLSPPQAQAMASLGRCLVLVCTAGELELRLRSVEEAVLR